MVKVVIQKIDPDSFQFHIHSNVIMEGTENSNSLK